MKKNLLRTIFFLLTVILFAACKKDDSAPATIFNNLKLPESAPAVATSQNEFAYTLFNKQLHADNNYNNKLISPLSVYLCLAMAYNGADGTTKAAMEKAMAIKGISIDDVNNVCKAIITQMPEEDSKVVVSIANSIWYNSGWPAPLNPFLDVTSTYYGASVKALDFAVPSAVNTINDWVSANTKGKIEKILDATDKSDLMYLVNAIYFNGSWTNGFKSSATTNDIFYAANGSNPSVPFMSAEFITSYFHSNSYTGIELRYGSGKGFSMFVIKPSDTKQSLNDFVSSLNLDDFQQALHDSVRVTLSIKIPKWEYGYGIPNMTDVLSDMGMTAAFSDTANFSKMYSTGARITRVAHKAYIKVNEEGTEAAAATVVVIGTTAVSPPREFKLDHPFVYLIMEKQSGSILFAGTVNDPSKH